MGTPPDANHNRRSGYNMILPYDPLGDSLTAYREASN